MEKFTLELKNNVNFIIYPNIDENLVKQLTKMCSKKIDACKKIKINYDNDLNLKINKNLKYIILYDSNNTEVSKNKNYFKKFNNKYLKKKNNKFFILDSSKFINNYKDESKKLLKFIDLNISMNNLNLLSLL